MADDKSRIPGNLFRINDLSAVATPLDDDVFVGVQVASLKTAKKYTLAQLKSVVDHNTGITAFATGGQASAVALTARWNNVTTCATAGDSVKLEAAAVDREQSVKNSGAADLDIFPATDDKINALAADLAVRIPPGGEITFRSIDAVTWETRESLLLSAPSTVKGGLELKAADSSGNTITTITHASQAAKRTYTVPDAGADANFAMSEGAETLNGVKTFGSIPVIAGIEYQMGMSGAKVGAGSGWAVKGAADLYEATLPQSQTDSTLIIPIGGLMIGSTITAFKVAAQIESAGGACTLDADLRKQTVAAGDPTDASVGTISQVSVSADTAVASAKTGLSEVVAADEWLYILIKATTAATTDMRFLGCTVTVTEG